MRLARKNKIKMTAFFNDFLLPGGWEALFFEQTAGSQDDFFSYSSHPYLVDRRDVPVFAMGDHLG